MFCNFSIGILDIREGNILKGDMSFLIEMTSKSPRSLFRLDESVKNVIQKVREL